HTGTWLFYLKELVEPWYSYGLPYWDGSAVPWSWLAPPAAAAAATSRRPAMRACAIFLILTIVSFLTVISAANSYLLWYVAPIYPQIAVLVCLGVQSAWERIAIALPQAYRGHLTAAATIVIASVLTVTFAAVEYNRLLQIKTGGGGGAYDLQARA